MGLGVCERVRSSCSEGRTVGRRRSQPSRKLSPAGCARRLLPRAFLLFSRNRSGNSLAEERKTKTCAESGEAASTVASKTSTACFREAVALLFFF